MLSVKLTPSQILQGANAGVLRQVQNLQKNRTPRYGADNRNDWQLHVEGCLGEIAVASYLGIFWDANLGMLHRSDVGELEVRCRSKNWYDLIIHHEDSNHAKYVLITGVNGSYDIHGWIYGYSGKNEKYWSDPAKGRPAFFVPKSELNSMDTIFDRQTHIAA